MALAGAPRETSRDWPPRSAGPPARRVRSWLLGTLLTLVLAASAVAVVLTAEAARYQPVSFGNQESTTMSFPGLPTGRGIRPVNDLGGLSEDFYLPPQRSTFSLSASIRNNGSHAVTIESVSLSPVTPFRLAGPVRYALPAVDTAFGSPGRVTRVLHDVVLQPGELMDVGFPVQAWPCGSTQGWEAIAGFVVRERFAWFRHTVTVPWGMDGDRLIFRPPGGHRGQPHTICATA
jgi:hypothetical protein